MRKKIVLIVLALITLVMATGCQPEQGKPPPRQREPEKQSLSDFWFLGRVFDGQHKERGGVPIHLKGEVIGFGPNQKKTGHVEPGPGCTASGPDAMICEAPTAQLLTVEGAGTLILTFSFATNALGWQMQCVVSPNRSGIPILEQDTSDRTSGRGMEEAIATCSFP